MAAYVGIINWGKAMQSKPGIATSLKRWDRRITRTYPPRPHLKSWVFVFRYFSVYAVRHSDGLYRVRLFSEEGMGFSLHEAWADLRERVRLRWEAYRSIVSSLKSTIPSELLHQAESQGWTFGDLMENEDFSPWKTMLEKSHDEYLKLLSSLHRYCRRLPCL